ncbi:hypothetical protein LCGC14_2897900 [marine sediment metagenome]|uniref:Ribbon-helix-helix protein CopG domain-containing protein n=1 Tax=marine sediment metagenome TaxID=412755 RepID=A0A0F8XVQ6_9ZZZZ
MRKRGRPKLDKEVLTIGLTITVTKSENKKMRMLIEKNKISMNQFFRDLFSEKLKREKI